MSGSYQHGGDAKDAHRAAAIRALQAQDATGQQQGLYRSDAAPAVSAPLSHQEQIKAARAELAELAKQYDDAHISLVTFEAKRGEIEDRIADIRAAAHVSVTAQAAPSRQSAALSAIRSFLGLPPAHARPC